MEITILSPMEIGKEIDKMNEDYPRGRVGCRHCDSCGWLARVNGKGETIKEICVCRGDD